MNIRLNILCISLILVVWACNNGNKVNQSNNKKANKVDCSMVKFDSIQFNFKSDYQKEIDVSAFFDVKFIQLEATANSMIGNLDKAIITSEYIIVLDNKVAQKVFLFNRGGKFVRTIGKRGRGPGEYTELADIDCIGDAIFLYADDDQRILKYDFEGQFISSIDISKFGYAVNFFNDQSFFTLGWGSLYNLTFWDSNGKLKKHYYDHDYDFISWQGLKLSARTSMDTCLVYFPFNSYIYEITKNRIAPKYFIDMGRETFPISKVKNKNELKKLDHSQLYSRIGALSVSSNVVCVHIYRGKSIYNYFYFPSTNKKICSKRIYAKGIPTFEYVGEFNNGILMCGEPYEMLEAIKDKKLTIKGLEGLDVNDNLVLIVLSERQKNPLSHDR